jgi:hypothetical protein
VVLAWGGAGRVLDGLVSLICGGWHPKVFEYLEKAGWLYSIGLRNIKKVRAAVDAIDESAWQNIDYPAGGQAQIAETTYGDRRLIVRRTRLLGAQAELFPDWRHFALITNRTQSITIVEAEHRDHAVVEQVIADLKDQALAHFPSGDYDASAWTVLAALAHNPLRWTQLLGLPDTTVHAARTLRRRLLAIPGRLTHHARGWTLRCARRRRCTRCRRCCARQAICRMWSGSPSWRAASVTPTRGARR